MKERRDVAEEQQNWRQFVQSSRESEKTEPCHCLGTLQEQKEENRKQLWKQKTQCPLWEQTRDQGAPEADGKINQSQPSEHGEWS